MTKIQTFILLILFTLGCREQSKNDNFNSLLQQADTLKINESGQIEDSLLREFALKWKADSLGQNGFRMNHYSYDKKMNVLLINGMTLKKYSKEKIITLLGNPTSSGLGKEDKKLILFYIIRHNKSNQDKTLILYFDKDKKLDLIMEETGM